MVFAVEAAKGEFQFGTPQDLGWIAGYLLFAAMTWHPEASTPAEGDQRRHQLRGPRHRAGLRRSCSARSSSSWLYPKEEVLTRTQTVLWVLLRAGGRHAADPARRRQRRAAARAGATGPRSRPPTSAGWRGNTEVLLSSVGDGIYGVDLEGRITFLNPSAAASLGHAARGAPRPGRAHDVFHGPQEDGSALPVVGLLRHRGDRRTDWCPRRRRTPTSAPTARRSRSRSPPAR